MALTFALLIDRRNPYKNNNKTGLDKKINQSFTVRAKLPGCIEGCYRCYHGCYRLGLTQIQTGEGFKFYVKMKIFYEFNCKGNERL